MSFLSLSRLPKPLPVLFFTLIVVGFVSAVVIMLRTPSAKLSDIFPESAQQINAPTSREFFESGSPLLVETDTHFVVAQNFSLQIPETWDMIPSIDSGLLQSDRIHGELFYGNVFSSEVQEDVAYSDPETVRVMIKDVLKNGRSFESIVSEYVWDETDVAEIVAFMKSEATDIFPDFSENDVRVSVSVDQIGTSSATIATRQCLKPCYIEGGAQTTVRYLIDAADRVYILEIIAETSTNTVDQLNGATAVVKTFRLIPSST